jgi:hypothetical protein
VPVKQADLDSEDVRETNLPERWIVSIRGLFGGIWELGERRMHISHESLTDSRPDTPLSFYQRLASG